MEYVNELYKVGTEKDDLITLAKLLKPFAPHLASEMLGKLESDDEWPVWDKKFLKDETIEIIVQVNGKLRAKLPIPSDELDDEGKITALALEHENVKKFVKKPKKTIYVKSAHLLNLVA